MQTYPKTNKLTERKKELLKEFVNGICEECHKKKTFNNLEIHRIKRGNVGGKYVLRNIKIVCSNCHKLYHSNEFR